MRAILPILLKRISLGIVTIIVISVLIFVGVEALPGDLAEAVLGQSATPETIEAFRKELKLNLPPHVRYFAWLEGFLRGDLGTSQSTGRPVSDLIVWRFKNTLFLAASTAMIAIPLAVMLGILSAFYRNTFLDKIISVLTLSAISLPEFFIAYILIAMLSIKLVLFPSICTIEDGMSLTNKIYEIFLPSLTLSLTLIAYIMRHTRASIVSVIGSPYIEMAKLKGLKWLRIILCHALPNSLAPIINVIAISIAYLIAGVVIVEVIFVYPGLGQLLVDSVSKRDIPVVQASGLLFAATYVGLNLAADILTIMTNPRLLMPGQPGS